MGRKRQSKKTEQSRRVEDERRLRRHLHNRNPEFPFLVKRHTTHTYTQRERERARKRENDSLTLPTVDDAKMIIMPESLQCCQNPLPFPILGDWPIQ